MPAKVKKVFQKTFGRTPQTKILDQVWHHRSHGVNIKELSRAIRNSYVYTVNIVNDLSRRGLVVKKTVGRESIVTPNTKNGAVKAVTKA